MLSVWDDMKTGVWDGVFYRGSPGNVCLQVPNFPFVFEIQFASLKFIGLPSGLPSYIFVGMTGLF